MPKLKKLGADCWLRYMNDTLVVIDKTNLSPILEILDSQHQSIKFTFEEESNNGMPFLDVQVTKKNNSLHTTIYTVNLPLSDSI